MNNERWTFGSESQRKEAQTTFNLIELLVKIAVIAILAAEEKTTATLWIEVPKQNA